MLGKDRQRFFSRDSLGCGDEVVLGHDLSHSRGICLVAGNKTHISIGDDAHQDPIAFDYRDTGDPKASTEFVDIGDRRIRSNGDGIRDHA